MQDDRSAGLAVQSEGASRSPAAYLHEGADGAGGEAAALGVRDQAGGGGGGLPVVSMLWLSILSCFSNAGRRSRSAIHVPRCSKPGLDEFTDL